MRKWTALRLPALPLSMMCWSRQLRHLFVPTSTDDEEARPRLWDAVVGGVQYLPSKVIPSAVDLSQQALEGWLARLVVEGEGVDVLEKEVPRSRFRKHAGIRLKKARGRVHTGALP